MSVIQIPNLPAAIALNGTEQLEAVQAGTSVRVTTAQIAALVSVPLVKAYYGSFISSVTQTNPAAGTGHAMYFDATPIAANGVTLASNGTTLSRITVTNSGVYNLAFSAQISTSSGGSQAAFIWIKVNGNSVVKSNTEFSLAKNNANLVAAWNWVVPLTAGQYIEIAWDSADLNMVLPYIASPAYGPAIPSVIATINAVG